MQSSNQDASFGGLAYRTIQFLKEFLEFFANLSGEGEAFWR
jgi:hypothetical protein